MSTKQQFMRRALDLARLAEGCTAPNPMVGAVVVDERDGRILGEGYHHRAGEPHAEVLAIRAASGKDLTHSTLYVTLEPCSHYGKTPPCADLIIEQGIPRVIIAMQDPFPKVSGRGIEKLCRAGIEVEIGLMQKEAESLNRAFLTAVCKQRPYITLKWAETADGYIDRLRYQPDEPALQISSPWRQRMVHKLRSQHDAILVGGNTLRMDNPKLNNRLWWGPSPQAIVLSRSARIPIDCFLREQSRLATSSHKPLIAICSAQADQQDLLSLEKDRVDLILYGDSNLPLADILRQLCERGIHSLLVEGGRQVLDLFIKERLFDRIEREKGREYLGQEGIKAPNLP